jgi:hypothetical protein
VRVRAGAPQGQCPWAPSTRPHAQAPPAARQRTVRQRWSLHHPPQRSRPHVAHARMRAWCRLPRVSLRHRPIHSACWVRACSPQMTRWKCAPLDLCHRHCHPEMSRRLRVAVGCRARNRPSLCQRCGLARVPHGCQVRLQLHGPHPLLIKRRLQRQSRAPRDRPLVDAPPQSQRGRPHGGALSQSPRGRPHGDALPQWPRDRPHGDALPQWPRARLHGDALPQ